MIRRPDEAVGSRHRENTTTPGGRRGLITTKDPKVRRSWKTTTKAPKDDEVTTTNAHRHDPPESPIRENTTNAPEDDEASYNERSEDQTRLSPAFGKIQRTPRRTTRL